MMMDAAYVRRIIKGQLSAFSYDDNLFGYNLGFTLLIGSHSDFTILLSLEGYCTYLWSQPW